MKNIASTWKLVLQASALLIVLTALPSAADDSARATAAKSLAQLQAKGLDKSAPDEHASIMFVYSAAERYWQAGNHSLSERYFRLSTQKAGILLASFEKESISSSASFESRNGPVDISPQTYAEQIFPETEAIDTGQTKEGTPQQPGAISVSTKLIGSENFYTVRKGDTLKLVAARLGVSRQQLISLNRLPTQATLKVGQKLKYNNRKIVPTRMQEGILINIPDRTLYLFKQGELAASAPVALGTPRKTAKYDWTTPTGKFKIIAKQKDPVWFVPRSIRSEMEEMGKEVVTTVPPGPKNPLGKYALKTSFPGILIHSTTKPASIYSFASHGCVRIMPEHMEKFFKEIQKDTPGEIVYQPVKLAVGDNGRVFLEVHRDVYGKGGRADEDARQLIESNNLAHRVDWKKVRSVVKMRAGLAEDITF